MGRSSRRRNMFFHLLAVGMALLFMTGGCESHSEFKKTAKKTQRERTLSFPWKSHTELKKTTEKTPASRIGKRHTLNLARLILPGEGKGEKRSIDLRVGFIYAGTSGDYGFTYAQNRGRLTLMEKLGVQTMAMENVPEDERSMKEMQSLIDNGCKVIFICSLGFMDYTVKMAEKHPDVYFFHCAGYKTLPNLSTYFGRMYQIRYMSGIVAGMRTKTNKIGYIAAFPVPEVIRGANAFALGVKSVNPNAKIYLKWSNAWANLSQERALALDLLDEGCDVLAQHQDTVSPQIAAQDRGAWSIGYNSPMGAFAQNAYLTGALWNWGPYMIAQIQRIADGTWKSSQYWGGMEDDVIRLDALTKNVAPGTPEAVEEARRRILRGFDVFEGAIHDNAGRLRVPEGRTLSDEEKLTMDWFVDNVSEAAS